MCLLRNILDRILTLSLSMSGRLCRHIVSIIITHEGSGGNSRIIRETLIIIQLGADIIVILNMTGCRRWFCAVSLVSQKKQLPTHYFPISEQRASLELWVCLWYV